jgi:hypothetical protein
MVGRDPHSRHPPTRQVGGHCAGPRTQVADASAAADRCGHSVDIDAVHHGRIRRAARSGGDEPGHDTRDGESCCWSPLSGR